MLFSDRRSGVLHDIGMNAPPSHDPAQGLVGWASAHHDAQRGLAATFLPDRSTGMPAGQTVVPGGPAPRTVRPAPSPYDFRPSMTSPAEQRGMAGRMAAGTSRVGAWSNGSVGTTQTITLGTPMRGVRSQNVLPSFVGQKLKAGPSFAQRARRAVRMP